MIVIIKNISFDEMPKPMSNFNRRLSFIPEYLHYYKHINSKLLIQNNNLIQVVTAISYVQEEDNTTTYISLPSGLTEIEIICSPILQSLSNIFKEIRFLYNDAKIEKIYLKNLFDESRKSLIELYNNKELDEHVQMLLKISTKPCKVTNESVRFFELINNSNIKSSEIELIIKSKLLSFLLNQTILNNGTYSFPLLGWKKEDLLKNQLFIDMSKIFNRVCFAGFGNTWISTHLIVSEPFKHITQFSSDKSLLF